MKRYVLLENNEIADRETYEFINDDYIVKEADNILDLIEAGDLVKYGGIIYQVTYIYKYEDPNLYDIGTKGLRFDSAKITAIYKPNIIDGYDLAWECEEE